MKTLGFNEDNVDVFYNQFEIMPEPPTEPSTEPPTEPTEVEELEESQSANPTFNEFKNSILNFDITMVGQ